MIGVRREATIIRNVECDLAQGLEHGPKHVPPTLVLFAPGVS